MTPPPTSIDGTDITGATIDGQDVQEITVDGQTVFSPGPKVIDDFEATLYEDQNQTLSDYYGVDTSSFSRSTSSAESGTFGVEASGAGVEIHSTSLPNTPVTQGQTIQFFHNQGNANDNNAFYFGVQSVSRDPDSYQLRIIHGNNLIRINVLSGGSKTEIASMTDGGLSSNEWFRFTIDWATDGKISVTMFDLSGNQLDSMSGSDTSYTSGGIGFKSGEFRGHQYWDEVTSI